MAVKKRSAAAAATAASPEGSARSQKRRRIDAYIPETQETAEITTILGLQVIEAIRQTKDKHGRLIAGEFERLPDPDSAPGYYRAILLPISLQMVEQRLKNHEYRQLTHVECDLRRLVSNAKHYNENGSALFSNAERIRKVLAAEFPKINPAYSDPNYVPFSTPVPEDKKIAAANLPPEPVAPINEAKVEGQPETPYLRGRKRTTKSQSQVPDKPPDTNAEQQEGFEGLTFEAAQAKIISEMIKLKDETGLEVFYNFISKPDKTVYKEYYDIIKHPTSLRAILKLVRGTDNRKNSLKRSPFRTWDALEEEVSYIWRNASEFNEPGSAIVQEAEELKKYFLERLAEVRKVVPDPPPTPEASHSPATLPAPGPSGTRLKLKMGGSGQTETPQRITLRLNGKSQNEGAAKDGHGQGAAKQDTQQETSETPRTRLLRERPARAASQKSAASVKDFSPQPKPAAVKHESVTPSLANGAANQQSTYVATSTQPQYTTEPAVGTATTIMAATPFEPQYHSQSTEPGNVNFASNANPPPPPPPPAAAAAPPTATPADIALDQFRNPQHASAKNNKSRKDNSHHLLSTVEIFTHPDLYIHHRKIGVAAHYRPPAPISAAPFHICIPPSTTSTQQSVTFTLPSSSHTLRIIPTIIPSNLYRQTNLSVTVGGQKLAPSSSGAMHQAQYSMPGAPASSQGLVEWAKPSYDIRFIPGVTRVDLEIVGRNLAKTRGLTNKGGAMDQGEVDYESLTLFIHLLR